MSDAIDAQRNRADDYCYLTTTGRRTGHPHRIEIWYAADGGTLYLLSGGGRSSDWVQNLELDPGVLVELDGDERRAHGRVLEGGDEAERARTLVLRSTHRAPAGTSPTGVTEPCRWRSSSRTRDRRRQVPVGPPSPCPVPVACAWPRRF